MESLGKDQLEEIPLFQKLPKLRGIVPHVRLITSQTPVFKLEKLGSELGVGGLYLKDDGLTGTLFGGNKVRKLEFLLADALSKKAKRVLTFGAAGSNHALATAVYAKSLGLETTALLMPQTKTPSCHTNLLYHTVIGTDLHAVPREDFEAKKDELVKFYEEKEGVAPYVIPTGGSNEIGVMGYVNAAFELASQIEAKVLPTPDYIYVAASTCGTASGLILGLKILKLKTAVRPIRVSETGLWTQNRYELFIREMDGFLKEKTGVSAVEENDSIPEIRDYLGKGYGAETAELREAMNLAKETENVNLEIVYTAKSMAALIEDARKGELKDKTVLYWKTNNSIDLGPYVQKGDAKKLPDALRKYIDQPSKEAETGSQ